MLEPTDLLALAICQPGAHPPHAAAALLLGWERPASWSGDKHTTTYTTATTGTTAISATALSAGDLRELRRLALFVGYGLLGDPQHARYVARVGGAVRRTYVRTDGLRVAANRHQPGFVRPVHGRAGGSPSATLPPNG